ncbi:hypothetical protein GUJ93_ZPchr0009g2438 [Zizania palustris]|uniref:CASP-like protein n=1 Tax=Zizania palustris TaxID=103762 RepID=A0A8J5V8X8_ZIZPA|nr:hypothetical protein GUJ93_ZPchr0009g2438 [Zizania palustris]
MWNFLYCPNYPQSKPSSLLLITWVLLLKAHRTAGKLTGAASAALSVAVATRRRVAAGRTDDSDAGAAPPGESPLLHTRFYGFIRAFLLLSMLLLAVDVAAHIQDWHLGVVPDLLAVEGFFAAAYASWVRARLEYLASAM